jgi:hypothetical protein
MKGVLRMKRNLDLIRYILISCEEDNSRRLCCSDLVNDEYSFEEISYHVELLIDEFLVEADGVGVLGSMYDDFIINRLTAPGHDYLDSVRDASIWKQTKSHIGSSLPSVPLSIISEVASSILKSKLGI